MKRIKIAGMFIALTMLASVSQAQQQQNEQITVPLSEPGKSYTLNLGLVSGSIRITGYEGKDIVVEATGERGKGQREKPAPSGMKRLSGAGNGLEVTVEEKSNKITVHSNSHARTIDFVIKVPASGGKLKLSTVNDGDITVSNVNGEIEVSNVNGDVTLTGVGGSVVANTHNGDMLVTLKNVESKPMAFTTFNGKVDVTLPADIKTNLKAKSEMGEVFSDFDVAVDNTPKVTRSNEKGLHKLNIEAWVNGKINGGGSEMMMKTFNGNIYIRKAK
jgi:DUF4097 and DUF4098 domain-containing protein YvlB